MNDDTNLEAVFAGAPLMAILRGMGVHRSIELSTTAWHLGINAVEIPLQKPEDEHALRAVVEAGATDGRSVGAGTIIAAEQIPVAVRAGARYLVSPGLDRGLVQTAREAGIPLIPGVATPSDVQHAVSLGLTWLKAFPATWLGTEWFRHIRGPFPGVTFVATGGLNAHNAPEYLRAGARVVAIGSALEDPQQLEKLSAIVSENSTA